MIAAFEGFPVVIEFRHKEWIRESVFEGLVQRKASVAFCDMPQLKALPNAYLQNSFYSQFIGPMLISDFMDEMQIHGMQQVLIRMEAEDMIMNTQKGS